jgi:hypothetical protein
MDKKISVCRGCLCRFKLQKEYCPICYKLYPPDDPVGVDGQLIDTNSSVIGHFDKNKLENEADIDIFSGYNAFRIESEVAKDVKVKNIKENLDIDSIENKENHKNDVSKRGGRGRGRGGRGRGM